MPKPKKNRAPANTTAANVGYEADLWQMADALRETKIVEKLSENLKGSLPTVEELEELSREENER